MKSLLLNKLIHIFFLFAFITLNSNAQISIIDNYKIIDINNDSSDISKDITLSNVNEEIEKTDNLIIKYDFNEHKKQELENLIANFEELNIYINKLGAEYKEFNTSNLSSFFLKNAKTTWIQLKKDLRSDKKTTQKKIRETQLTQNYLQKRIESWNNNLPKIRNKLSAHIYNRILKNNNELKKINRKYDNKIKKLLIVENNIIEDIVFVESIIDEIDYTLLKHQKELLLKNKNTIFTTVYKGTYEGSIKERIKLAIYENTKTLNYFLSNISKSIVNFLLIVLMLFSYFFFISNKYKSLNLSDDTPGYKTVERVIIKKPITSSIAVILFLWLIIIPYTPIFISKIISVLILLSLMIAMKDYYNVYSKRIIVSLTILIILNNFEIFAWYFGSYSRIYLLLETSIALILTILFILPKFLQKNEIKNPSTLDKYSAVLIPIILILFIISFLGNIIGYVNLSIYTIKLGVYLGIITIIIFGFYRIINSIIQASINVLNIYLPNIVSKYETIIINKSKKINTYTMIAIWIITILEVSEFSNYTDAAVISFFTYPITIGKLVFSLNSLILFFIVIYISYLLTVFTKQILEKEILSRGNFNRGIPAAISLTIRTFIVFFGTIVALSVTGMDLSKISIIAGALSVGIGFGLQNVVNNFISGIILVYEKPIQEGDTVEVDNLLGKVTNLGIRASRVQTYDGAEVVVPNANLTSNQLINWTLSDNKKRVEIKVGTAYGTDPNEVLKIMKAVALENKSVLPFPEPNPLFEGFGDSSLDFRLLFWVHFEDGFTAKSEVAIGIYNAFAENNITIPFPQVDLHVKEIVGDKKLS